MLKFLHQAAHAFKQNMKRRNNNASNTNIPAHACYKMLERSRNFTGGLAKINAAKKDITSQMGEDGIIDYLVETLGLENKTCFECGAWDGKHCSNSWNLIENHGWQGILIEADTQRYNDLPKSYTHPDKNIYINAFITHEGANTVDRLIAAKGFKGEIDVMVIDIDGNDWHIFNSLEKFQPNVAVIEYNPSMTNDLYFVQDPKSGAPVGCSLAAIIDLGKKKGYEAAFVTDLNVFLVKKHLYPKLGIISNAIDDLRPQMTFQNFVFQGYDGRVYATGNPQRLWSPHEKAFSSGVDFIDYSN